MGSNIIYGTDFYDGILRTEDGSFFKIHRLLLAQRSEYFRALFTYECNNKTDIVMKEIRGETLQHILHYLYEGALSLNLENLQGIMIASDYLLLDDLMEQCREFAIRCMTTSECLPLLIIAAIHERINIFRECSRYAKVNFEDIVKNFPEKIADLPIELLTELLKDNSLNVTSEDTVGTAIDIWVKADFLKRNKHIPELLNCVRFEEGKPPKTKRLKKAIEIFNPSCIGSNSFSVARLPQSPSVSPFLQTMLYRETVSRFPKYLHVVVSRHEYHPVIYLTFDEKLDFWRFVGWAPLIPHIIIPIGKYIYLFDVRRNVFIRYDLLDSSFILLEEMMNRFLYCIVELNKKIYALGGGKVINLEPRMFLIESPDTVDCYDPESERWNKVKAVGARMILAAAAISGRIYAIGRTCDGFQSVVWMRVYDPITDNWNTVEPPSVSDPRFSAVGLENRLYLVGEGDKDGGLEYVGEYDSVLDVWTRLPCLPFKYEKPKPLVLAGKFMVFDSYNDGISDKDRRTVAPAVYWDGVTRFWQITDKSFAFYNSVERYRFGILDDQAVIREVVNRGRRSAVQWDRIYLSE